MLQEIDIDRCIEVEGKKVPVFDCHYGPFTSGVQNVTLDNVTAAGFGARDQAHRVTTLRVKPFVFFNLRMRGQIYNQLDGRNTLAGTLFIEVDSSLPYEFDTHVLDSHLCDDHGEVLAVLRTREY